jgi:hypothetical protein
MVKKTLKHKKKSKKNNNTKHINKTLQRQGRGINYNLQKQLIKLCYAQNWNSYDDLVQTIISNDDYLTDFFESLSNYSGRNWECLERCYEEILPHAFDNAAANNFTYYSGHDIKQLLVTLSDYPTMQEKLVYIIKDNTDVREKLFYHLNNNIHNFSRNTLEKLQTPISQLQELAVQDAWKYQSYINTNLERRNGISNTPINRFTAQGYRTQSRYYK